jgi:hypothetical protein
MYSLFIAVQQNILKFVGLKQWQTFFFFKFYLMVPVGQGSTSSLAEWSRLKVCYMVTVKMSVGIAVIWRLDWNGAACFQGDWLTYLASLCWLLVRGLSSSLHGLSTGCFSVLTPLLQKHLIKHTDQLYSYEKGHVGCEYQEVSITRDILKAGYHTGETKWVRKLAIGQIKQ